MTLNQIAKQHSAWVEQQGWRNKTVLECLALVASEVGEAVNECRNDVPTPELGSELADIILRVADLADMVNINLELEVSKKMKLCQQRGTRGRKF